MNPNQDTIAAVATATGRGGVGIIRVSGPRARAMAITLGGREPKPRYAHYGPLFADSGDVLDEGLLLFFPGPHSFTGEDVLELQGHGGPVVLDMLLQSLPAARRAAWHARANSASVPSSTTSSIWPRPRPSPT